MNSQGILGDSLARGLVHQQGRDVAAHLERTMAKFQRSLVAQKESRGSRYRELIGHLKDFCGNRTLKTLERGERKKRQWESFVVEVDEEGTLQLSHLWVPFKNPSDFDSEYAPWVCHPHCHQRLLQIHRGTDLTVILGVWAAHLAAFEDAFSTYEGWADAEDLRVMTFGDTEVLVWRPATIRSRGWESISAVSLDALYGPKKKAYERLKAGYTDPRVYAVTSEQKARYVGRGLRERIFSSTNHLGGEAHSGSLAA